MIQENPQPLFRVSNHHTTHCGIPPAIDGDAENAYHGYFENAFGEQFIFVYDRNTKQATVFMGDGNWDHGYAFRDGCLFDEDGLPMVGTSDIENRWLQVCWDAATRFQD